MVQHANNSEGERFFCTFACTCQKKVVPLRPQRFLIECISAREKRLSFVAKVFNRVHKRTRKKLTHSRKGMKQIK